MKMGRTSRCTPGGSFSQGGIHESHTPNPAGDHRRRLRRRSAPSCVCRGRLAVADRAAGVALRGGRGKRHLVAYPGRAVRAQPQPAVHRREQAGRGHPRRQRTGLARRAGRIHLPLCGSAVCDGRSPVRETELQPQGSAAGGDGHDGAVVPGGERAGALQDPSGNDRLRQVEARRPDLWFAGRRLAAASGRRTAVQGCRRQGPHRSLPRRQHGLHGTAGEPSRRHVDRDQHRLAAHPERLVARAGCGVGRAQPDLSRGSDLA